MAIADDKSDPGRELPTESVLPQVPFPFDHESRDFLLALSKRVQIAAENARSEFMSTENVHVHNHGTDWQAHNADDPDRRSSLTSHSHEIRVTWDDIKLLRYEVLLECINDISESMVKECLKMLYTTVQEACDASGRVVSGRGIAPADAFIAALDSVEFGVEKNGEPSFPQVHLHPQAYKALIADLDSRGSDFKRRIDDTIEQKRKNAVRNEEARRARFRS